MQKIILYYKFTPVTNPEEVRKWQTLIAAQRGLNGRVIVSEHGINGTLGGEIDALEDYIYQMDTVKSAEAGEHDQFISEWAGDFSNIAYKWSDGGYEDFPRLNVKYRKELVTLAPEENFDVFDSTTGLTPEQWHEYIEQNPDTIILDARNDYESDIGAFRGKNVIKPKIGAFKEIKKTLEKLPKDQPVLTYCTGDVRCEYLSAYMKHKGFDEVYHLDGGIVKYGEKFGDQGYWDGKCFVFDRRLNVAFSEDSQDIGVCEDCGTETSNHTNCGNKACNSLVLKCTDCQTERALCTSCVSVSV